MTVAGGDARHVGPEPSLLPSRSDGVVEIRPFGPQDIDAHLAGEDDETRRWFRFPRASTRADVEAFVGRGLAAFTSRGPRRTFAIVRVGTGEVCGHVEANHLGDGMANLSYSVYPPHRRRGLAVRAVRLCMAYADDELPIDRFVIRVEPENVASVRVAERCGFVHAGLYVEDGVVHHEHRFDLLAPPAVPADPS